MDDDITDVIAIDGPAGAGKSTAARRAAEQLGFAYLDTGAMYRAATWRALDAGLDLEDAGALVDSTRRMALDMQEDDCGLRVRVDGRDVTEAIRSPEVTRNIYRLDQNPDVRAHLVSLQRAFAAKRPTVAEGRDMGTVVFPRARCKVFLDADLEERTRRRAEELIARGLPVDMDRLRAEIHERDEKNRTRTTAPLRRAPDATYLDTSSMSIDEVVAAIVALAAKSGVGVGWT